MASEEEVSEIGKIRKRIDDLNVQLLFLLNDRAKCALEIGYLKKEKLLPIHDPEREKRILDHLVQSNQGPLGEAAIRRIFNCIIEENRRLEEKD